MTVYPIESVLEATGDLTIIHSTLTNDFHLNREDVMPHQPFEIMQTTVENEPLNH